ncbi:hypothetical protein ACVIRO_001235 [Rhizobium ruizarguesonis]
MTVREAQRIIGDHPLYVLKLCKSNDVRHRRAVRIVSRAMKRGLFTK